MNNIKKRIKRNIEIKLWAKPIMYVYKIIASTLRCRQNLKFRNHAAHLQNPRLSIQVPSTKAPERQWEIIRRSDDSSRFWHYVAVALGQGKNENDK